MSIFKTYKKIDSISSVNCSIELTVQKFYSINSLKYENGSHISIELTVQIIY
jgi:hypothetical protein